jgi:hypothetical protein
MNQLNDFNYNSMIENILKGVISGFLIAYLLIFGLIPSSKYPDDILDIMDNPWIFAVILIINFYILYWDLTIGLLLFISLIALMLDIIIFTDGELFNDDTDKENFEEIGNKSSTENKSDAKTGAMTDAKADANVDVKSDDKKKEYLFNKSYKDINDIVIGKLKEYKELSENNVKAYNSFI